MAAFFILVAAVVLLVSAPAVRVVGQKPGFLSIDCGLDAIYGGYKDPPSTGIDYVPDGAYVDSGENHVLGPEYQSQAIKRSYLTLRSFPSAPGVRNCYTLPTVTDAKYLVRMEIFYGNYDDRNSAPATVEFDLYLGPNFWTRVTLHLGSGVTAEAIFVAWASWVPVCLLNTGRGTPIASVLELRPLADALYPSVTPALSMATYARRNMGATSFTRSPADGYDRFWWAMDVVDPRWTNKSTGLNIQPHPNFVEPLPVLQTAIEAPGNGTMLTAMTWSTEDRTTFSSFMVFLHFADFQNAQLRQFDIYFNGNQLGTSHSPLSLVASCVYSSTPTRATDGRYNTTLVATAKGLFGYLGISKPWFSKTKGFYAQGLKYHSLLKPWSFVVFEKL